MNFLLPLLGTCLFFISVRGMKEEDANVESRLLREEEKIKDLETDEVKKYIEEITNGVETEYVANNNNITTVENVPSLYVPFLYGKRLNDQTYTSDWSIAFSLRTTIFDYLNDGELAKLLATSKGIKAKIDPVEIHDYNSWNERKRILLAWEQVNEMENGPGRLAIISRGIIDGILQKEYIIFYENGTKTSLGIFKKLMNLGLKKLESTTFVKLDATRTHSFVDICNQLDLKFNMDTEGQEKMNLFLNRIGYKGMYDQIVDRFDNHGNYTKQALIYWNTLEMEMFTQISIRGSNYYETMTVRLAIFEDLNLNNIREPGKYRYYKIYGGSGYNYEKGSGVFWNGMKANFESQKIHGQNYMIIILTIQKNEKLRFKFRCDGRGENDLRQFLKIVNIEYPTNRKIVCGNLWSFIDNIHFGTGDYKLN